MQATFNPEPLWLARRRKGLTQKQVADILGKHRYTIIRIESGKRSIVSDEVIRRYAEFLGVDPSEVLCGPEPTS